MKKIMALVLAMVMALSLAACASTDKAPAGKEGTTEGSSVDAKEKPSVKTSGHPYIHALPGYYADISGMYSEVFDEYTIDMYANGPVQNEAIASGAWEVGTTGLAGLVLGAVGYDLKAIGIAAGDTYTTDIWVRADSPLAKCEPDENGVRGTADDWRGLTYLCVSTHLSELVLGHALEYQGLSFDDITMINTDAANCYTAYKAGEGDVTVLVSPYGYHGEEEGWVKICSADMLGLNMPCIICATDETIRERPEVVQLWLETFQSSADYLLEHEEETVKLFEEFSVGEGINVSDEQAQKEVKNRPFPTREEQIAMCTADENGVIPLETILLEYADYMKRSGKITEEDYQKLVDNSMVDPSFALKLEQR